MKRLILLCGVVLVLLIGVGAALTLVGGSKKEKLVEVAVAAPQPPPPSDPITLDLSAVSVPLVRDGKVRRHVTLLVKYDVVTRPGDKAKLDEIKPYLRDALVREAHNHPFVLSTDGFELDLRDVETRMVAIGKRFYGADSVRGVQVGEPSPQVPSAQPAPAKQPPPKKSTGGSH